MGAIYTQLSIQERRRIEDWWHAKVPVAEMARVLRRHKSTIFREIKRNFWADDAFPKEYAGYFGMAAHQRTQRRRSTQRKLIRYPELCQRIVGHLKDGWTPEGTCRGLQRKHVGGNGSITLPSKAIVVAVHVSLTL